MPPGGAERLSSALLYAFRTRMEQCQGGTAAELVSEWKAYAAWDLQLRTRDARRKAVRAVDITEFGQLIVKGIEDGVTETLIADYLD